MNELLVVQSSLFVLFGLLFFVGRASSEQHLQRVGISLRQALVPALIDGHHHDQPNSHHHDYDYHSVNNRGVDFLSLKSTRFGQRTSPLLQRRSDSMTTPKLSTTQRDDRNIVWSQPDPRKFYSPPISTIKVYKNDALFGRSSKQQQKQRAKKLNIGETLKRSSSVQIGEEQQQQQQTDSLSLVASEAADQDEQSAESSRTSKDSLGRKQASAAAEDSAPASGNHMVTLIKYVPVLLSVPADSVIPLPAAGSSLITNSAAAVSTVNNRHRDKATTQTSPSPSAYFGLYKSQPPSPIKVIKYHTALAEVPPAAYKLAPQMSFDGPNQEAENQLEPDGHYQPTAILIQQQPAGISGGQGSSQAAAAANEINMIPTAASNAKFAYLPGPSFMAPASLIQTPSSGSASKALSAYASKLMSMLRPSSLLSSINTNQPAIIQQAASNQQPPQIYLLAPAEGFSGTHLKIPQSALGRPAGQESMLNQASRLQLSTASLVGSGGRSARGPPTSSSWAHQQSNGLICVHSFVPQQKQLNKPVYNQPVLASPFDSLTTTTMAPNLSQQQQQQLIDTNQDQSFDYAPWHNSPTPTTTAEPPPPYSKGGKQSPARKRPKSSVVQQASGKDSPAKLAKLKANKQAPAKSSAAAAQSFDSWDRQQQQHQVDELESPMIEQQKLTSSPSESRGVLESSSAGTDPATRNADHRIDSGGSDNKTASSEAHRSPSFRASRRHGNDSSQFIPFTIRDKIDLPMGRPAGLRATVAAAHVVSTTTNNPVVFDEPAESELELQDTSAGAQHKQQRYSWPPQWLDERRVRTTSFVSSSNRNRNSNSSSKRHRPLPKPTASSSNHQPDKQIDYRRDAGPSTGGYTLPLLMASTAGANQRQQQHRHLPPSPPPLAPPFMRPPMTISALNSRPATETGDAIRPAASQQVTSTSSSLDTGDGQPVTLASGTATTTTTISSSSGGSANEEPAPKNQRRLQRPHSGGRSQSAAAESRLSSTTVLAGRTSNHTASEDNKTVELVVDSSPEQLNRASPDAVFAPTSTTTTTNEQTESTTSDPLNRETTTAAAETTSSLTATTIQPPLENHATLYGANEGELNSYSNERQLGGSGSMLLEQDFGRISESLQTNPMDLIDLQNSRSSFELPSQLESLSMLSERQQPATLVAVRQPPPPPKHNGDRKH